MPFSTLLEILDDSTAYRERNWERATRSVLSARDGTARHAAASARAIASRFVSFGHRAYIRIKLRFDHIYRATDHILAGSELPLLDVGCGIGLLGHYLLSSRRCLAYTGIDCDLPKLNASVAAASNLSGFNVIAGDATELPEFSGNVALLDVLHYLSHADQERVLRQCAARVAVDGVMVIRTVLREAHWRFYATVCEEVLLHVSGWMPRGARDYPSLADIVQPLEAAGLTAIVRPLWGATPYNSYLMVASRKKERTVSASAIARQSDMWPSIEDR